MPYQVKGNMAAISTAQAASVPIGPSANLPKVMQVEVAEAKLLNASERLAAQRAVATPAI